MTSLPTTVVLKKGKKGLRRGYLCFFLLLCLLGSCTSFHPPMDYDDESATLRLNLKTLQEIFISTDLDFIMIIRVFITPGSKLFDEGGFCFILL
jgi:hypothetical protein